MKATRILVATALALATAGGCGSDDTNSDTDTVPTAEQLAAALLSADDLDGEWSISLPPDAPASAAEGIVTDETRELLPSIDLCPEAGDEARAAVDALRWSAFRQLELAVDDPIKPPDDRSGHLVFVQEFLAVAPTSETTATFEAVRSGMVACLGELPADEEGPGMATEMATPDDLGDDRFGVLTTIEEAGGWAQWRLHQTIVRQGPVLAVVMVADIVAGDDTKPLFTQDEIDGFARLAIGKL